MVDDKFECGMKMFMNICWKNNACYRKNISGIQEFVSDKCLCRNFWLLAKTVSVSCISQRKICILAEKVVSIYTCCLEKYDYWTKMQQ